MKLESLKSSKFDAFKENELHDTFRIFGGQPTSTTYKSGPSSGKDCIDYETDNGSISTNLDGSNPRHCDYRRGACDYISPAPLPDVMVNTDVVHTDSLRG